MLQQMTSGLRNWGIGLIFITCLIISCIPVKKDVVNSDIIDLQATTINLQDSSIRSILKAQNDQDLVAIYSSFHSPNASARYASALALGSIKDIQSADTLSYLLRDANVNVAAAAAYSIGQIGKPESQSALINAFRQYDTAGINSSINSAILEAIGKLGTADFLTAMATVETYQPDDTALLLGQIRGIYRYMLRGITDPAGTSTAIKYATTKAYPQEVRMLAAHYLARAKDLDLSGSEPLLKEAYSSETDLDIKLALIQAVGKTKTEDSKNLLLDAINNSSDDRLAASAMKVLNNFDYTSVRSTVLNAVKNKSITIASAALSYLEEYGRQSDAGEYKNIARENLPWQVKLPLMGIANKNHGYAYVIIKGNINSELKSIFNRTDNLSEKTAALKALASDPKNINFLLETGKNSQLPAIHSAVMEGAVSALKSKHFNGAFGGGGENIRKQVFDFIADQLTKGDEAALEIIENIAKDIDLKKIIDVGRLESIKSSLSSNVYAQHMLGRTLNAVKGVSEIIPQMNNAKSLTTNDFALENTNNMAEIVTDKGSIKLRLLKNTAPATVLNFIRLVKSEFFNGKNFHRVVPNFVIQGGCPRGDGYGGMDYSIRSETPQIYYNKSGMVGMASSGPHTESCQFFITHSPTPHLDGKYTIFAEVISGMDVVNQIQIGDKIQRVTLSE